jgi:ferric-dicitrate binding protein FerR (iron transport regulator)
MEHLRDEPFGKDVIELIDRYFLYDTPPAPDDAIYEALEAAGIDLDALEQWRLLWEANPASQISPQARVAQVRQRLQHAPEVEVRAVRPALKHTVRLSRRSVARVVAYPIAMAVVAAILLVVGWRGGFRSANTRLSQDAMSTYATTDGERAMITLPDSSVVVLNVGSRMQVPANYTAGNRTVYLSGEALFTVIHHESSPFSVISGGRTTRVLGTRFVVRHYATDTAVTVAVHDGKVAIQSAVLTAQQQAIVGSSGIPAIYPALPGQFTFATGVLTLGDMSLTNAIPELDRWYNADIRLGDPSLRRLRIEGKFVAGSLADLSAILQLTFDVRIVRNGHTLTLYPR